MYKRFSKQNKGFSLIELIVVISVMAVLTAVLAPTLLRYVEKTRVQKDESAVGEFLNALYLVATDQDAYMTLPDEGLTFKAVDGELIIKGEDPTDYETEVAYCVGESIRFESTAWKEANVSIKVTPDWDSIIVLKVDFPAGTNINTSVPME